MLVDMPLAVSEGLRAVPQLYGDEVVDHGHIKDWKTGMTFAGKNFSHGMSEGFSDVFTQPYKGGQREGALGVLKGLAKGTLGMTTKVSSGMSSTSLSSANGVQGKRLIKLQQRWGWWRIRLTA